MAKEPERVSLKIKRTKGDADMVYVPPIGLVHLDEEGEIVITVDPKDEATVRDAFKGNKDYSVRKV